MIYHQGIALPWQRAFQLELERYFDLQALDHPGPDPVIRYLIDHFPCPDLTVLEVGCWNGWRTCELARRFKRVMALDIRPHNLARTMLRMHLLGYKNVDYQLGNVMEVVAPYDVLVHAGVLYHLAQPIEHLRHVLTLCAVICLDTHINHPKLSQLILTVAGRDYRVGRYCEYGWADPLSGIDQSSYWLECDDIIRIVTEGGFVLKDIYHYMVDGGPRVALTACK